MRFTKVKRIIEETCPSFLLRPALELRSRLRDHRKSGKNAEEVFTKIYENHSWGSQSLSGPGSELRATNNVRKALPQLIQKYAIRSMLDAPCGDFHWMQHVPLDGVDYIGGDIVAPLIEQLQQKFGQGTHRRFIHLDIIKDPIPTVDLILCRDCFIHLTEEQIFQAVRNFKRSGSRYLLTTTHTHKRVNWNHSTGGCRPVNMVIPPYNFPPPLELIQEDASGEILVGDPNADHSLGLWELSKLPV